MKLLTVHVENFGTLSQYDLHAVDGLNTLYQPNGWGKSTLAVFIKAMLYGLPASSKRSLDENERKKYTPWQGGAFGGSIEFESEKGRFRAERFFGAKEAGDTFALYDLSTKLPSTAYSSNLGEELFGIDAEGFERSTYLSQRALYGKNDNDSITAKLSNLLDDVDDIGNYESALNVLENQRKHYVLTGNRGLIAELEQERLSVQGEIEKCLGVAKSVDELELGAQALRQEKKKSEAELASLRAQLKNAGLVRERRAYIAQSRAMQQEIAEKKAERQAHEQFFAGAIPTPEELNTAKQTLLQIQQTKARLSAMELTDKDKAELNALKRKYPSSFPNEETVAQLQKKEAQLHQLEAVCSALKKNLVQEQHSGGRAMPTSAELASIQRMYHTAGEKERAADALQGQLDAIGNQRSSLFVAAPMLLIGGLALLLVSFFFLPKILAYAMLSTGIAATVAGGVLWMVSAHHIKQRKQRVRELRRNRELLSQESSEMTEAVLSSLRQYGMKEDSTPEQTIAELSLHCARGQERRSRCKRIEEELAQQTEKLRDVQSGTEGLLRRYLPHFNREEQSYTAAISQLQKDAVQLEQLFSTLQRKERSYDSEKEVLSRLRSQIMPFLERYDREHTLSASACMDALSRHYAEWLRLGNEIAEQEKRLSAFLQGKQLSGNEALEASVDFEALAAEERMLQLRIGEHDRRLTELDARLERLHTEADKLPELQGRFQHLGERIGQCKEKLSTITTTMRLLEESKTALSTRYLAGMQKSFSSFVSQLTEEDTELELDSSFDVWTRQGGKTRSAESLSRGWRDLLRFCLRLSLTEALYGEGEQPILLLDDPFVNLDDRRMEAAKKILQKLSERYQIFYFICHSDRL